MEADDRIVLDQHMVGGCLRDPPRGEADENDAAFEGDAFRGAVVHVAAYRVEHDVGAATGGGALDLFDEILRPVVEREVGAELLAELDLLIRSRGGDDGRAGRLSELDRGAAHATRAGVDEQRLARLQTGPPVEP